MDRITVVLADDDLVVLRARLPTARRSANLNLVPKLAARRRAVVGSTFLAAGALTLIAIAMVYLAPGVANWWILVLSYFALAVAQVAIGTSGLFAGVARFAFALAAVGWLIIAFANLLSGVPGVLGLVAEALALLGSIAAGIVAYRAKIFTRAATTGFLVAMVITVVYLLNVVFAFLPGTASILLAVVYSAGLLLAGILVLLRR
jgi:hypothetical protein